MLRKNFQCSNLCPLPPVFPLAPLRKVALSSPHSCRQLQTVRDLLCLFFSHASCAPTPHHPGLVYVGQCLSCAGKPQIGQSTSAVVLQILKRGGKLPSLNLLAVHLLIGGRMLLSLQENTAESSSICCPPGPPGLFFLQSPAWISARNCSVSWAGPGRSSRGAHQPLFSTYKSSFEEQPPVFHPLQTMWCQLQTCPALICEALQHFVGDYQFSQEKFTLGKSLLFPVTSFMRWK